MASTRIKYPREALAATRPSLSADVAAWLGELTDVVFFASFETEEGTKTRTRVVFHRRGVEGLQSVIEREELANLQWETPAWQVLPFWGAPHVTQFNIECLVKAAPMAQLPRTALVVAPAKDGLVIEGVARRTERSYDNATGEEEVIVCTSDRPGQVILSTNGYPFFWYEAGCTLEIDQATELHKLLVDPESVIREAVQRICVGLVEPDAAPLSMRGRYFWVADTITSIVESMVQVGHGGLIAIVPPEHSIPNDVGKYRFNEEQRRLLASSIVHVADNESKRRKYSFKLASDEGEALEKTIVKVELQRSRTELDELAQVVGCLTSVDNAVILGPDLQVLCAGYQVETLQPPPRVLHVASLDGQGPIGEFALALHGSRHAAAASFAHNFPGSVVLVLSEDGALRCLHRAPGEQTDVLLWNIRAPIDL